MAVSVATLVKRRARLDEQIRQAEERERKAEKMRKDTSQAKYILGGLLLSQEVIPEAVRSLLIDQAAHRRSSDQGGWAVIAAQWDIELPAQPDLVLPTGTAVPDPASALVPTVRTPPYGPIPDDAMPHDVVLEISGAG